MNNMGVLKTQNGSAIFNSRLSWFIYTPTENLRIIKKISTFWHFILTLSNIAPNIVKPYKNQHFHQPHIPHLKPQSKPLSSYINTKSKEKSTFSPITNFLSNLPTNPHTNPTSNFSYLTSENYYFILLTIKHFLLPIIRLNYKKQTQISIKTISMIKSLSKIKNQKLPSKTQIYSHTQTTIKIHTCLQFKREYINAAINNNLKTKKLN